MRFSRTVVGHMAKNIYIKVDEASVPGNIRFDVPGRNQGQIVEIAYGGWGRHEHDVGDPYQRVTDRSDRSVQYYKLSTPDDTR